jgi:tetratricopeptide (TPR) repeat protein
MTDVNPTDNVQQLLSMGIAAADRGEYDRGLALLRRAYQLVPPEKAPQGLSSYGLCVAKAEKKNRAGAELAQKAIHLEFYEGRHWANLVRIYIAAKNRRKAVEVLEDSLRKLKKDKALLKVRDEIGYRQAPYLRFLPRQNPVNKIYSLAYTKMRRKGRPALFIVSGVIYIVLLAWLFVLITR